LLPIGLLDERDREKRERRIGEGEVEIESRSSPQCVSLLPHMWDILLAYWQN
jgi:hypothetical protein